MTDQTPHDPHEFAKALHAHQSADPPAAPDLTAAAAARAAGDDAEETLESAIVGAPPPEALVEDMVAVDNAPPVSDEELERQALADGGADGDPSTPE